MKIYVFLLFCSFMVPNVLGQSISKWTPKHIDVLQSFGTDTSDIRGIQFSINNDSNLSIEDIFKEFFSGSPKKDFYLFDIKYSEIPIAFFNRPLEIFEIIDLYLKLN